MISETKYIGTSSRERLAFHLVDSRCEIWIQRRRGTGDWSTVPGGPHWLRIFEGIPHPSHYNQFQAKFRAEPSYRDQYKTTKQEVKLSDQTNGNGNGHPLPEAPASATARVVSPAGFEWLLTCRDHTVSSLITKVGQLEETLLKHNWQPAGRGGQPAAAAAPAPAGQPAPQPPGDPQASGWCPLHNVAMKWRTGDGGDGWYSHKAVGETGHFWCRGK